MTPMRRRSGGDARGMSVDLRNASAWAGGLLEDQHVQGLVRHKSHQPRVLRLELEKLLGHLRPSPPCGHPEIAKTAVRPAGLEPATLGLEIPCSIRLSYGRNCLEDSELWNRWWELPAVDTVKNTTGRLFRRQPARLEPRFRDPGQETVSGARGRRCNPAETRSHRHRTAGEASGVRSASDHGPAARKKCPRRSGSPGGGRERRRARVVPAGVRCSFRQRTSGIVPCATASGREPAPGRCRQHRQRLSTTPVGDGETARSIGQPSARCSRNWAAL